MPDSTPATITVIASCCHHHPLLGQVKLTVRDNARNFRARWVGGIVHVTAPPVQTADYKRVLEGFVPRLLEARPAPMFSIGREFGGPRITIRIERNDHETNSLRLIRSKESGPSREIYRILVGHEAVKCIDRPDVQKIINGYALRAAHLVAERFLVPRARELSSVIGRAPLGWELGSGKKTLGTCSSSGFIRLSCRLVFLPSELSDFVILHELAHLSEMNHSERFHSLCNSYCGGRESELTARLKAFTFPVF